uniref:Uncharacterized protein n=1 Tax=Glossina austeni TaxID=7395 RepID=A0A1A9VSU2_GLOAU
MNGNWTVEIAKSKLYQFMQMKDITPDCNFMPVAAGLSTNYILYDEDFLVEAHSWIRKQGMRDIIKGIQACLRRATIRVIVFYSYKVPMTSASSKYQSTRMRLKFVLRYTRTVE